jgi:hypothetical protein
LSLFSCSELLVSILELEAASLYSHARFGARVGLYLYFAVDPTVHYILFLVLCGRRSLTARFACVFCLSRKNTLKPTEIFTLYYQEDVDGDRDKYFSERKYKDRKRKRKEREKEEVGGRWSGY